VPYLLDDFLKGLAPPPPEWAADAAAERARVAPVWDGLQAAVHAHCERGRPGGAAGRAGGRGARGKQALPAARRGGAAAAASLKPPGQRAHPPNPLRPPGPKPCPAIHNATVPGTRNDTHDFVREGYSIAE
jgi:hypothetical protein